MRMIAAGLVVLASAAALAADAPAKRFGVEADLKTFPQTTPKETLASILKAIELKRADYIVAHLADAEFVDRRVKETSYDELLAETMAKLVNDPSGRQTVADLSRKGSVGREERAGFGHTAGRNGSGRVVPQGGRVLVPDADLQEAPAVTSG